MASSTENQGGQNGHAGDDGRVHEAGDSGGPHKLLAGMAGSWTTKIKSWCEPKKPPMESIGTCEQKMVLGGRFLHQEFTGEMMGSPFTGIGVNGYDNHTKKYVSTWMDSMAPPFFFLKDCRPDGKTLHRKAVTTTPSKVP